MCIYICIHRNIYIYVYVNIVIYIHMIIHIIVYKSTMIYTTVLHYHQESSVVVRETMAPHWDGNPAVLNYPELRVKT